MRRCLSRSWHLPAGSESLVLGGVASNIAGRMRLWFSPREALSGSDVSTEYILLGKLAALTAVIARQKHNWVATAADEELLRLAAAVTGRPLTPETFDLAPSALAFLLGARFSLERRLHQPPVRTHSLLG
jgi:hypothetical protein